MSHFGERLIEAIQRAGTPALVGLDPRPDLLPEPLCAKHGLAQWAAPRPWARAVEEFCSRVLDIVAERVPAVKFQSAFFELHGAAGIAALSAVMNKAKRLGLVTILDAKRSDIASTAGAYAQAAFGTPAVFEQLPTAAQADALTVNPYLGRDSLEPFLEFARSGAHGLFVLVHTSNPGAADLQYLARSNSGRQLYLEVARWVRDWSESTAGRSGYGSVGAVVGGTTGKLVELRQEMPQAPLLVPGYGAQGATARQLAGAFDPQGLGALVNSSRSLLFPQGQPQAAGSDWEANIEQALLRMIADLAEHTPAGRIRGQGSRCRGPGAGIRDQKSAAGDQGSRGPR